MFPLNDVSFFPLDPVGLVRLEEQLDKKIIHPKKKSTKTHLRGLLIVYLPTGVHVRVHVHVHVRVHVHVHVRVHDHLSLIHTCAFAFYAGHRAHHPHCCR